MGEVWGVQHLQLPREIASHRSGVAAPQAHVPSCVAGGCSEIPHGAGLAQ